MCGCFPLSYFFSEMFEKALNAGFIQATDYVEIWQAYLDYLRRRVDFTQGVDGICVNKYMNCFLPSETVVLLFKKNDSSFMPFTEITFWPVSVFKM